MNPIPAEVILLDHGSGGQQSHQLLTDIIMPAFDNPMLSMMHDGAVCDIDGKRVAFSTDTFVVDPLFFPGGSIGDLAINGTVNDLAMCGAAPLYLSAGIVIEEGFPINDLKKVLEKMSEAAREADVKVVTGDTKVVPKGAMDKIFINTAGIGLIPVHIDISSNRARPGDKIIISGSIADHGMAILTQREGLKFDSPVLSDTAPLHRMVADMLAVCPDIHVLRDPTRGGVAAVLNEIASKSVVGITIYEEKIPLQRGTAAICELLGFDPLYVANEGKMIAFVPYDYADKVLAAMRADDLGKNACIIGEAVNDHSGKVVMQTRIRGTRIIDMPMGELLPRIC